MALFPSDRPIDVRPDESKVVLIGASTLMGKEIKAVIAEHSLPLRRLSLVDTLVDSEEPQGQLTDFAGEPAVIQPIAADAFEGYQVAVFASVPAITAEYWNRAEQSGCRVIDLSYFLSSEPRVGLRAPMIDSLDDNGRTASNGAGNRTDRLIVSAQPMAIALAGVMRILSRLAPIQRAAATILEPASERGAVGVDELHRQTLGLLTFQEIPNSVFDAQAAFNLLSRIGSDTNLPLIESRARINDHLSRMLGSSPLPAIQLVQAPVFHGYAFSCWVELAHALEPRVIEDALDQRPFAVRRQDEEQPSPVAAATNDEILIGTVQPDATNPNGFWIWGAFDNLRVAALNAELILLEMIGLPAERATAPAARIGEDVSDS